MANWAANTLAFDGYPAAVARIRASLTTKPGISPGTTETEFDFGNLIPMPRAIRELTSSLEVVQTQEEADRINAAFAAHPGPRDMPRTKAVTQSEARRLLDKYGAHNWYDWARSHWGTKWLGQDVEILLDLPSRLVLRFDTAWTPPTAYLRSVAQSYGLLIYGGFIEDSDFHYLAYSSEETPNEVELFNHLFELRQETETIESDHPDLDDHVMTHRWIELREHVLAEADD